MKGEDWDGEALRGKGHVGWVSAIAMNIVKVASEWSDCGNISHQDRAQHACSLSCPAGEMGKRSAGGGSASRQVERGQAREAH